MDDAVYSESYRPGIIRAWMMDVSPHQRASDAIARFHAIDKLRYGWGGIAFG